MKFQKLTLEDIEKVAPYFNYATSHACDTTVGGTFIWRDYFNTQYLNENDTLIFKFGNGEDVSYSYPLGKDLDRAFEMIEKDAKESVIPLRFYISSEVDMQVMKTRYPKAEVLELRDAFDYYYEYEGLATFKGKKYSGQRNHVNKFKRLYEDYSFEVITKENSKEILEFFRQFIAMREKNAATDAEAEKIEELLDNLDLYESFGFFGGLLRVNGNVIGFSFAERIGDTMFVHIEKADIRYDGAYQMLVSSFASHFSHPDVLFINREDDTGNEGLRKSKLSYQPIKLLPKYVVTLG